MELIFKDKPATCIITGICLFCMANPVFLWSKPFSLICVCLILICGIIYSKGETIAIKPFFLILCLLYLYTAILNQFSIPKYIILVLSCVFFLFPRKFIKQSSDVFINIICVVFLCSILLYLSLKIPNVASFIPYNVIDAVDVTKDISYRNYILLCTYDTPLDYQRFMCVFEEPGIVGTVAGIILFLLGFNAKDWRSYVVVLAGILSFSLAFYIMAIVWMIIEKKIISLTVVVFFASIILLYFRQLGVDYLDLYLIDRIQFTNEGFSGNNRTSSTFDAFYMNFKSSVDYLWGLGNNYSKIIDPTGASYKHIIVDSGFIFLCFYVLNLILHANINGVKSKKNLLGYIFLVLAILFQRPFIDVFFYIFLLFLPVYYLTNYR